MARTKDYDDYIDWTVDHGIDPADFGTFSDYTDAVIAKFPPVNFDTVWTNNSKRKLRGELTDFFKEVRTIPVKKGKPKVAVTAKQRKRQTKKVVDSNKKRSKAILLINRVSHRNVKQGRKSIATKTTIKNIDTIRDKRISGKKLTRSERKTQRGLITRRGAELRHLVNANTGKKYTQREAMERSHLEHGGV